MTSLFAHNGAALMVMLVSSLVACRVPSQGQANGGAGASPQPAETKSQLFALKRSCLELGGQRAAEDARGLGLPRTSHLGPLEYCYSATLNTCLYFWGISGTEGQVAYVEDLLTNRQLLSSTVLRGQTADPLNPTFSEKRDELKRTCVE